MLIAAPQPDLRGAAELKSVIPFVCLADSSAALARQNSVAFDFF